ncbi:MAG: ABC transporter permease [Chloroflexi bacterium]|nr:ABC transporter permease [Chloroflexota bacterium]
MAEVAVERRAWTELGERSHRRLTLWEVTRRHPVAALAVLFLGVVHLIAILAPVLLAHSPEEIDLLRRLAGPSPEHLLGTDENGRDVLARLVYGARVSLSVGLISMLISIVLGTLLGGVAGYVGGAVDAIIMRVTDGMLSIPLFFFVLIVVAVFGPTIFNLVLVIGLTSWMVGARVVRAEVLRCKQLDYVTAARALGGSGGRIFFRHVLPQAGPSIIVASTLGVAYAILIESSLSYLGLGVQPPVPSWGNMLTGAQRYVWTAPYLALYPGGLILLTTLAYNGLGDGLRDALDPHQRVD